MFSHPVLTATCCPNRASLADSRLDPVSLDSSQPDPVSRASSQPDPVSHPSSHQIQ